MKTHMQRHISIHRGCTPSCGSTQEDLHVRTHALLRACTHTHPRQLQTGRNLPSTVSGFSPSGFVLRTGAFHLQILQGKNLPVDPLTLSKKTQLPLDPSEKRFTEPWDQLLGPIVKSALWFPFGKLCPCPILGLKWEQNQQF